MDPYSVHFYMQRSRGAGGEETFQPGAVFFTLLLKKIKEIREARREE